MTGAGMISQYAPSRRHAPATAAARTAGAASRSASPKEANCLFRSSSASSSPASGSCAGWHHQGTGVAHVVHPGLQPS